MELVRKQVYIPPDMDRIMKQVCSAKKLSESEIIRQALEAYLKEHGIKSEDDPILKTVGIGASKGRGTGSVNHDEIYDHVY
ncbi:MAG: ribbon-helix-helix protein, CopG family [Clostridia bacterium]|nr:ribbon-helix-helix protein, CopG family [Clostridia bacterium]